jgi:hypothetical protein
MKRLLLIVLAACALAPVVLALPGSFAQENEEARAARAREVWVYKSMLEMREVKVGMTRGELLKVFGEEGGLSTRTQRTYAYKGCRYFKVNVKFEPAGNLDRRFTESPEDKIVEISKPYLDYSILD